MQNKKGFKDAFPMILAIIGIIADIIGIVSFIDNTNSSTVTNQMFTKTNIIITLLIMVYSWFVISWYFVQKYYANLTDNKPKIAVITYSTIGVGLLLLPISILIEIATNNVGFSFCHLLIWILIYFGIRFLAPVIYPQIGKNLKWWTSVMSIDEGVRGKYFCIKGYESWETEEKFKIGDFIQIYDRENKTDDFWYRSSKNGGGKMHRSELITFWEKE